MGILNVASRTLFCRDNIDVLRGINSNCIDLIYLDPPFNKKKVFTAPIGSSAQGAAFSDIFLEEDIKDDWVKDIEYENPELHSYLNGVKTFSNKYNYCYLVYMAIRLIECYRILKDTGSIYLHCDSTMSHYLKIVMDCVFGEKNFRNEIVWFYQTGGVSKKWFSKKHDNLLFYSRSRNYFIDLSRVKEKRTDEVLRRLETGNPSATRATTTERLPFDVWIIQAINAMAKERTGYPTQKPLALLEKIIQASSQEGDVILDPFCGCATTCVAAEKWGRNWIGVDVSHKAYELIQIRLKEMYDEQDITLRKPSMTFPLLKGGYTEVSYTTTPPQRGKDVEREQGYVYIISNANWEGIYKIGIAKDPHRRLNSYQTSDPYRAYQLEYYIKTPYYREIERHIHKKFKAENEWVKDKFTNIKKEINAYAQKLRR